MKKKTMKILRTRNQTKSCLPSAAAPAAAATTKQPANFLKQTVVNVWQVSFENFRWSEGQVMSQENVSVSVPVLSVISNNFLTIFISKMNRLVQ